MSLFGLLSVFLFLSSSCSDGDDSFSTTILSFHGADSLFTFDFVDDSFEVIGLSTLLYHVDLESPCGFFAEEGGEYIENNPFSVVIISLNNTIPGTHTIVPHKLEGQDYTNSSSLASASYVSVLDWKPVETVYATSGTVSLEKSPSSIEEWNNGISAELSYSLSFPLVYKKAVECTRTLDQDGNSMSYCECIDNNGVESSCSVEGEHKDCCASIGSEFVEVSDTISPSRCNKLCKAISPALFSYCAELD